MTVIIYDLRNATRIRVDNVEQIEACQTRMNGRLTNVWRMLLTDGYTRGFPQKHYLIERVNQ